MTATPTDRSFSVQTLQVFDRELADKLRASGLKEIQTQFNIEQGNVWFFPYEKSGRLCFDIDDAAKKGLCKVSDRFRMTF